MINNHLESQLEHLITGLAYLSTKNGQNFFYDGGLIYADEIGEIILPSILCIAQDLSTCLGMRDFGYRFELGQQNPLFPLHAIPQRPVALFFETAPFITEVFESKVLNYRQNIECIFEEATKLIYPEFRILDSIEHISPDLSINVSNSTSITPGID